jgi:hypothetical protein
MKRASAIKTGRPSKGKRKQIVLRLPLELYEQAVAWQKLYMLPSLHESIVLHIKTNVTMKGSADASK